MKPSEFNKLSNHEKYKLIEKATEQNPLVVSGVKVGYPGSFTLKAWKIKDGYKWECYNNGGSVPFMITTDYYKYEIVDKIAVMLDEYEIKENCYLCDGVGDSFCELCGETLCFHHGLIIDETFVVNGKHRDMTNGYLICEKCNDEIYGTETGEN